MAQLDDYFTIISPDEILVLGTRIGIEAIVLNYPPLTLEQVHATITYYLSHREATDAYLARWTDRGDAARERQADSTLIKRMVQHRQAVSHP